MNPPQFFQQTLSQQDWFLVESFFSQQNGASQGENPPAFPPQHILVPTSVFAKVRFGHFFLCGAKAEMQDLSDRRSRDVRQPESCTPEWILIHFDNLSPRLAMHFLITTRIFIASLFR